MKLALLKISLAAAGVAMLAGCAGVQAHKGAILDPQLVTAIQPGVDNKDSVAKTLGQPTFAGEFTSNDWYYYSRDTSTLNQSESALTHFAPTPWRPPEYL